jgi:hypothetical protein
MQNAQHFPFVEVRDRFGIIDALPQIPLQLTYRDRSITAVGLLDTGASVNVLPHKLGLELGLVWDEQTTSIKLGGNLAATEARGLVMQAKIGEFQPVRFVFAWSRSDNVPLLLGRTNFFQEFDVCIYGAQKRLEIRPKL